MIFLNIFSLDEKYFNSRDISAGASQPEDGKTYPGRNDALLSGGNAPHVGADGETVEKRILKKLLL